jgi:integrase
MSARTPVEWRGSRVPNLYTRVTSDGATRYDVLKRLDGRLHRHTLDVASVSEAVRVLPAALRELEARAKTGTGPRLTFKDWADDHLANLRERLSRGELNGPGHIRNTEERLRHLEPLYGVPVADLTPEHVDRVLGTLTRARRVVAGKPRPYAPSTIRSVVVAGHAVCNRAVRKGALASNPFALIDRDELPRLRDGARARLGLDDVHRLLDAAPDRHRPLLAALALTGARVGEVLALRWSDVDFQNGKVAIERQLHRDGTFARPKTAASRRVIDLDLTLEAELRRHRRQALELGQAAPDDLLFQRPTGGPVSQRHTHRWLLAAAAKAGLPALRLHDLRHGFGSILVTAGVPITTVSRHLGHANPAVTMSVYARELDETQRLGVVRDVLSRSRGCPTVAPEAAEQAGNG